ncbi:hypothetical protein MA16_Dca023279 [Dendrobium catenatum]|uniref:Uncharacterized protein n=1 Tax=Dendrobium catenatum TaxID=906689 RepID=A0A2I0VVW2_9ASPA|nr:hypothetical protein MA16_Dca023279 [Dendrobium catenatum]
MSSSGSLMSKPFDEVYALIEEMTLNNFQWSSKKVNPKKVASVHELDDLSILATQLVSISKKLDNMGVSSSKSILVHIEESMFGSGSDPNESRVESLNAINNRPNNLLSNAYSLGWLNYPNLNWSKNQNGSNI